MTEKCIDRLEYLEHGKREKRSRIPRKITFEIGTRGRSSFAPVFRLLSSLFTSVERGGTKAAIFAKW